MRQIQSFKFFELGEHHEYAMTLSPEGYLVFEIFRRLRDGCELPLLYVYIYIYMYAYTVVLVVAFVVVTRGLGCHKLPPLTF